MAAMGSHLNIHAEPIIMSLPKTILLFRDIFVVRRTAVFLSGRRVADSADQADFGRVVGRLHLARRAVDNCIGCAGASRVEYAGYARRRE